MEGSALRHFAGLSESGIIELFLGFESQLAVDSPLSSFSVPCVLGSLRNVCCCPAGRSSHVGGALKKWNRWHDFHLYVLWERVVDGRLTATRFHFSVGY